MSQPIVGWQRRDILYNSRVMMAPKRINLWRDYARRRWGEPVGKIILTTGISCPHREQGGCAYCAPESFRPYYLQPGQSVEEQLELGRAYLRQLRVRCFMAGFQQETASAGDWPTLAHAFQTALKDPDCLGLIVSTRPDYASEEFLQRLESLAEAWRNKVVMVEVGLQTANDKVLAAMNRGHTTADFMAAAVRIRSRSRFELGAHLILGLPGERLEDMRQSVQMVVAAGVQHLKLHHLQIVKGTPLARQYARRPWPLPEPAEYLDWLCALLPEIPRTVVLHRLWSTCRPDLLLAPRWEWEPNRLYQQLAALLEARNLRQGEVCLPVPA
ncbi:MAG: TIGR01212 family radical SAM protein [Verrucomicrobiae bacterium]|nr:TIGR01212 family radical SAM protein [Verrucomicrobiae bacterium]